MPSTRELKTRIRSAGSIRQITKAMELVSSARLRKASEAAIADRPYAEALEGMIARSLAAEGTPRSHPLLEERETGRTLLVVFASNRGLAGAYTSNLVKAAGRFADQHPGTIAVTIGGKVDSGLRRLGLTVLQDYPVPHALTEPGDLKPLADFARDEFLKGDLKEAYVLYAKFNSLLSQEAVIERFLPVSPPAPEQAPKDLLFEPPAADMLDRLLPYYAEVKLYQAALESSASEHAARRLAMKSATDNASERINRLNLTYNQLRQGAITQEIAEIVGGSAALE